jgi:polyhydroxyalkanoate synthesis regulator phasin
MPHKSCGFGVSLFFCWALLGSPATGRAQEAGVAPPWEVRQNVSALAEQARRLEPVLEQLRPAEWVRQGAPEAYATQLKSTREQLGGFLDATGKLTREPERLTAALEVFFRLDSLGAMLSSLAAGVRKYQNPALADLLESMVAEGAANRERLRQYVVDLAADQEQAFKVADQEAQRCRALLSRQPPAKNAAKKEQR